MTPADAALRVAGGITAAFIRDPSDELLIA